MDQKTDDNIYEQISEINVSDRRKLNGHPSFVIWMTGLSGAGKSTLANEIEKILHKKGANTYILDGDNLRGGLNRDLGFSDLDRSENIRRVHLSGLNLIKCSLAYFSQISIKTLN